MSDTKKRNRIFQGYEIKLIMIIIIILLIIIGLFIYVHIKLKNAHADETVYNYHYVFVSKSDDSYTANHIFEEAKEYGKLHGVYVERFKESMNLGSTDADYVKMATAMKVDGIILEASDDPLVKESINEADENGIPTMTILSDCEGSNRKSFMELGAYNLGREYGRIIIDITNTRSPKVMVLVDDNASEVTKEVIAGITETLKNEGNHLDVQMVEEEVDGSINFRLMSKVNDILSDDANSPDMMICMNERDTQIVHQAIIDYSLSSDAQIIGTGVSESLLKAIKDGEFSALVDVDASQAGMMCIDAMNNYIVNGSINEHIIAEEMVITKDNVERFLNEE